MKLNDILAITPAPDGSGANYVEPSRYRRLHLRVTSLEPIKGNLEMSLLKSIADQFDLPVRKEVQSCSAFICHLSVSGGFLWIESLQTHVFVVVR